jgi:hypothetical protein
MYCELIHAQCETTTARGPGAFSQKQRFFHLRSHQADFRRMLKVSIAPQQQILQTDHNSAPVVASRLTLPPSVAPR